MRFAQRTLPLILLTAILALVYGLTISPDITWANRGADGGDLITAAATNGVPHPSGYPTYLLLACLFRFLPWGTLAYRTNFLSAVTAVFAALVVDDLVRRLYAGKSWIGQFAGVVAGLGLGLSSLFWSQAVITEVYTLHALFVALILGPILLTQEVRLFPKPPEGGKGGQNKHWQDRLGGLLFGLALGNHTTITLLLPPFLLSGITKKGNQLGRLGIKTTRAALSPVSLAASLSWRVLARKIGWLCIGLLVYLVIPLRANSGSPVVWGEPFNWIGFWWLISGQYYRWRVFALPLAHLWPRLQDWAVLLVDQFSLFGVLVIFYGLIFIKDQPQVRRLRWTTAWIALSYGCFALGYNTHDAQVLLMPLVVILAVWLGLGSAMLIEGIARWEARVPWLSFAGGVLLVLSILLNAWKSFPHVDASGDTRAVSFGREVLSTAPQKAILFTLNDEDTFTLWYYHYALGERPDLALFQKRLLPEDWYRERMRAIYPDLIIPKQTQQTWYLAVMAANPDRPNCEFMPDEPKRLSCKP